MYLVRRLTYAEYMRKLSLEIVQTRKNHPEEKRDLLNAMLKGIDPKTKEALSEDSIVDNMVYSIS